MARPLRRYDHFVLAAMLLVTSLYADPNAQTPTQVPGTHVALVPPIGFILAQQFPGFQHAASGSSIMVTEVPAPLNAILDGLTEEALRSKGMIYRDAEEARLAGRVGLLISVNQTAQGIVFRKWLAVFGNDSITVMIVAAFPESRAAELEPLTKQAILSAQWTPEQSVGRFEGLSFRIQETAGLKIAGRVSNMLMLTKDGKMGDAAPTDPLLLVGSSLSQVRIDNIESFSRSRLLQTATVTDLRIKKGTLITISGLPAYEILADARDTKSGVAQMVYQVIIPRTNEYCIVQGLVGATLADKYLPEFRAVTASLTWIY